MGRDINDLLQVGYEAFSLRVGSAGTIIDIQLNVVTVDFGSGTEVIDLTEENLDFVPV